MDMKRRRAWGDMIETHRRFYSYDTVILKIVPLNRASREHDYQLELNIPKNGTRVVQANSLHYGIVKAWNELLKVATLAKNCPKIFSSRVIPRDTDFPTNFFFFFFFSINNIAQCLITFWIIWTRCLLEGFKALGNIFKCISKNIDIYVVEFYSIFVKLQRRSPSSSLKVHIRQLQLQLITFVGEKKLGGRGMRRPTLEAESREKQILVHKYCFACYHWCKKKLVKQLS